MKEGVVFDMDDTLYKEYAYRDSGYRTVARHFSAVCRVSEDELYRIMTDDPSQAFERVESMGAANGVTVTVADQLTVYRSHLPDISLSEDAVCTLSGLREKGVEIGVITDGRAWGQLNKIKALNLKDFIDESLIIPTVLFNTDKHYPEPFAMMERIMRARGAERLTYVGDNPSKDFLHPNLRGWRTIMLRDINGENIHRQHLDEWPAENRPRTVIDSLTMLPQLR